MSYWKYLTIVTYFELNTAIAYYLRIFVRALRCYPVKYLCWHMVGRKLAYHNVMLCGACETDQLYCLTEPCLYKIVDFNYALPSCSP